jgi:hypothetical protein
MSLSSTSWFRGLAATSAAVVFAVAGGAAALADDVYNSLDATIDATIETTSVQQGLSKSVSYIVRPQNGDGNAGCNIQGAEALVVDVVSSAPGVATVSPSSLTFSSCSPEVLPTVTVTGVTAGTATISLAQVTNNTGGTFVLSSATFAVSVVAPAKTATTTTISCPTSATYDGSAHTCTATTKNAESVVIAHPTPTYSLGGNINAGSVTATATFAETSSYFGSGDRVTFSIAKAAPACDITGYSGPYDGTTHGATGACKGVDGIDLAGLNLGDAFTDAPGGTANWSIAASTNYAAKSGSVPITIGQATPNCDITGYNGTYDGNAHGASGTCKDVDGNNLAGLNLGDSFTNAPGGKAHWSIAETTNYSAAGGSLDISIGQATPNCIFDGFVGTYDGNAHGATGGCTGVRGEILDGLTIVGSYTNVPGGSSTWSVPESTNYKAGNGSVAVIINKADPACSVAGYTGVYDGNAHTATGTCTDVKGETLDGRTIVGSYTNVPGGSSTWSIPESTNYNARNGSVDIIINKADATCSVSGYTGVYDGNAHGATGSCTGVDGNAASGLDLGSSFTAVPGGTAHWVFSNGNYLDESGDVAIVINKWTLSGFYAPIDKGIHNTVKAGATVPLKFEVFAGAAGTAERTDLSAIKSFTAAKITCDAVASEDQVEELAPMSGTSLRYDTTGGQFIQNWQTPKAPNTCYKVTVTTLDGSSVSALFKLK